MPRDVTKLSKPQSIITATEVLVSQSLSSQWGRKGQETLTAHHMADNCRNVIQSNIVQESQAACKPCRTSPSSWNQDEVKTMLELVIHKPHRLGIDT